MIRFPKYTMLVAAFFAVYFVWGSTYLAIRVAIETMPPLTMLGFRFGLAGLIMLAWIFFRSKDKERPTLAHWKNATIAGLLMLCGGTGTVAVAMNYVPSGMAALVITTVPLWMVLLNWLWKKGPKPTIQFFVGFAMGLIGVSLLIDPQAFMGTQQQGIIAIFAIAVGSIFWSTGSLFGRDADTPANPFLSTALQMTMGGVCLLVAGGLMGERLVFSAELISMRSLGAWLYLFGFWLIYRIQCIHLADEKHTSPSKVSTYAYVNPVIAVYLGWAFAGEPITPQILIASILLVSAVVIVLRYGTKQEESKVEIPQV